MWAAVLDPASSCHREKMTLHVDKVIIATVVICVETEGCVIRPSAPTSLLPRQHKLYGSQGGLIQSEAWQGHGSVSLPLFLPLSFPLSVSILPYPAPSSRRLVLNPTDGLFSVSF